MLSLALADFVDLDTNREECAVSAELSSESDPNDSEALRQCVHASAAAPLHSDLRAAE